MIYKNWLAGINSLANQKKILLCRDIKSARNIYNIEEIELRSKDYLTGKDIEILLNAQKESMENMKERYQEVVRQNIRMVSYEDMDYPEKLRNIENPPYALYVKGQMPDEKKPVIAIVGARRCTAYGEEMAILYGEKLAEAGVQIVSGMAKGIDGAAQRGALNAGGLTYGVLGSGVDICYPKEHMGLYMDIQKNGCVLAEYPPGTPPLPANFPRRNRIISGLADVVLVIEAKERSGSLITADFALEQGKDVYALPGPVTSPLSSGCNRLIRQGAGILLSPEDLMSELNINYPKCVQDSVKDKKVLENTENVLYSCVGLFPKDVSQLMEETGLDAKEIFDQLITLQLRGMIKEVSKNYYVRTRQRE